MHMYKKQPATETRERSFIRDLQIVGMATVGGWFRVMTLKQEGQGKVHASGNQTVAPFGLLTPAHVVEGQVPANAGGDVLDSFQGTAPRPPHLLPTHSERGRDRERRGEKKGERGEEREKGIKSTVCQQNSRGASLVGQLQRIRL